MAEWRALCRAANRLEAELLRGWLAAGRIPVMVRGEAAGALYGFSTGALAEVELLVPEEYYCAAKALLQSAKNARVADDVPSSED
ncbi:MAG: putative signal transducing protein [Moorellales bacterium]